MKNIFDDINNFDTRLSNELHQDLDDKLHKSLCNKLKHDLSDLNNEMADLHFFVTMNISILDKRYE
jgi:hypothetical protein